MSEETATHDVEFITYVSVDMTQPGMKIEPLGDVLPDGTMAVSLGPDAVAKFDSVSLARTIGRLKAIQFEMAHGRQRDDPGIERKFKQ